jgi:Protein of unknown function (DUF3224)
VSRSAAAGDGGTRPDVPDGARLGVSRGRLGALVFVPAGLELRGGPGGAEPGGGAAGGRGTRGRPVRDAGRAAGQDDGMTSTAKGTFEVTMQPGPAELDGAVGRLELAKTWSGDLQGTGAGVMLSAGDPQAGAAGYVAIETVRGSLGEREGSFALQQFGTVHDGAPTLHYAVVPGSGTGGLAGLTGTLHLDADPDGTHRYELRYSL